MSPAVINAGLGGGAYAVGVLLLAAIVASAAFGGRRLRARLVPDASGAGAVLATTVLAIGLVIAVELALGAVGQFRRGAVAIACVAVGMGTGVLTGPLRSGGGNESHSPVSTARTRWNTVGVVASVAVAVVAAQWSTHVFASGGHGIVDVDSLDYHLTFAARFSQTGWITHLNLVDPETATAFHPANAELVHGLGITLFGRDFLSVVMNGAWVALLLLAAWCVGKPAGRAPVTMLAAAALLAPPLLVETQAGTGQNDVVAAFFLVACVALLSVAENRPGPTAVAGLAAALAIGTKLTVLVPVVVLTIGVVVMALRRPRRINLAVAWLAPLAALGSFWFMRNLVHVGNPLPALHLGFMPRPSIGKVDHFGYSVAHYLTDGTVLRKIFVPELRRAFGVAWPATLAVAVAGLVLSVLERRSPVQRMAGIAGLAAALAYLVTPTTAGGPPGIPVFFEANLRYLWPALLLGFVLLPTCEPLLLPRARPWVVAGLGALLAATEASSGAWPARYRGPAVAIAVVVAAGVVLAVVVRHRQVRTAIAVIGVVAAVALGYPAQRAFARNRYRDTGERLQPAYGWARDVRSARVALTGLITQFPLYGPDLSNRVQFVGHRGPHGAFSVIGSCREWREAVNRGRFQYAVTAPGIASDPIPPATAWTKDDPAARQVVDTGGVAVFRLNGAMDPSTCPPS